MQKNSFNYYSAHREMRRLDNVAKDIIKENSNRDYIRFTDFNSIYDTHYHCDLLIKYGNGYLIADAKTISDKYVTYDPFYDFNFSFRIVDAYGIKYDEESNHPDVILFVSRGCRNDVYGFLFDSMKKLLKQGYLNGTKEKYVLIPHHIIKSNCDFCLSKSGLIITNVFDEYERELVEEQLENVAIDKSNGMKNLEIDKIFNNLIF